MVTGMETPLVVKLHRKNDRISLPSRTATPQINNQDAILLVSPRVGQMGLQVLEGALASSCVLGNEAQEGEHRQAGVLDLPLLEVCHAALAAGAQAQGVKGTAGVTRHTRTLE